MSANATDLPAVSLVLERMRTLGDSPAVFAEGRSWTYAEFLREVDAWRATLQRDGCTPGTVCAVLGEFSPDTCALFFALMLERAIAVPIARAASAEASTFLHIAGAERVITFDERNQATVEERESAGVAPLVARFRLERRPGLIVFTSGSTGTPKGILHDCERVMRKFTTLRPGWRTVLFLLMDHFGGFNTFLSAFAYGGSAVCLKARTPQVVCRAIEESRADLLPTTPTFLNLLVASGAHREFDLSSVRLITYGTEVMPETTLRRVIEIFPNAHLKQTYGLSEVGVLRSKSQTDASIWLKLGGEGFEVKVVDNTLWVRSESSMVGYLNAPDPFDSEGWLCTGDVVEVRDDYLRILGRRTEFINVGGQKVFPSEVESLLLGAENVLEATVFGARHPLMGEVVHARVTLGSDEDHDAATSRLRRFCVEHLARYKVPVRFWFVDAAAQRTERYKKVRRIEQPS